MSHPRAAELAIAGTAHRRPSASTHGRYGGTRAPAAQSRSTRFLPSLGDVFSIEASFVLFLLSGRYKTLPELRSFPVDFTLFFFVVTFCLIGWALTTGKLKLPSMSAPILLMGVFCAVAAASLFWSSLEGLNTDKAGRFLLLTSSGFFVATILAADPERRGRLLRALAWVSCAILLYYAYYRYVLGIDMQSTGMTTSKRVPEDANTYLEYNSLASGLFIIFLALAVFGSLAKMCAAIVGAGLTLFALVTIGGRGPLALAMLAIPLLGLGLALRVHGSVRGLMRLAALLSILISIAALVYASTTASGEAQFHTLERYQLQLSHEDTGSLDGRIEGQEFAFNQWLKKPIFGWGIGEFRVQDSYLGYPHNLLLEILMEIGIVGAFFFFSTCVVAVVACFHTARDRTTGWVEVAIGLLFLTELVSHLTVQGYLADDRIFLAYIGMAVASRGIGRRRYAPVGSGLRPHGPPLRSWS